MRSSSVRETAGCSVTAEKVLGVVSPMLVSGCFVHKELLCNCILGDGKVGREKV